MISVLTAAGSWRGTGRFSTQANHRACRCAEILPLLSAFFSTRQKKGILQDPFSSPTPPIPSHVPASSISICPLIETRWRRNPSHSWQTLPHWKRSSSDWETCPSASNRYVQNRPSPRLRLQATNPRHYRSPRLARLCRRTSRRPLARTQRARPRRACCPKRMILLSGSP